LKMVPSTPKHAKETESKYYFTGIPCKYGHVSVRYTMSARCCECARLSSLEISRTPISKEKRRLYKIKNKKTPRVPIIITTSTEKEERKKEYARKYYNLKKDYFAEMRKKNPNSEKRKKYITEWTRSYRKTAIGSSIGFMRKCINRCLINRSDRTSNMLGYTKEDLRDHIEKKFKDGMSWENRGKWHIDHIVPIKHFLDNGIDDPKIINSLSNLQPLWAEENLAKSSKVGF